MSPLKFENPDKFDETTSVVYKELVDLETDAEMGQEFKPAWSKGGAEIYSILHRTREALNNSKMEENQAQNIIDFVRPYFDKVKQGESLNADTQSFLEEKDQELGKL